MSTTGARLRCYSGGHGIHGFAGAFDGHVREQLPWYELVSAAMGLIPGLEGEPFIIMGKEDTLRASNRGSTLWMMLYASLAEIYVTTQASK